MSFVNPELFHEKHRWLELSKTKLKQVVAPFMMRRTKKEVLQELPPKYESTYSAPLTMEQKQLYLAYLAKLQEDSLKHLDPKKRGRTAY
ncbi:SNF2-related protein [Paenibacillus septentrionalis]|uniref:SNF2-related protein n=1 Tax=Paenibacillus septentrionalis TaxID=429342 RepID=UPI003636B36A